MIESEDQPVQTATKPCRVCGEDINSVARKCIHCSSWQNWRRWIDVSNVSLALLIAVIAATTGLLPAVAAFAGWLAPKEAHLNFSIFRGRSDTFPIFVSNTGSRPAVLTGISLSIAGAEGNAFFELWPNSALSHGAISIMPGELRLFEAQAVQAPRHITELTGPALAPLGHDACLFVIRYANFDGTRKKATISFLCDVFADVFRMPPPSSIAASDVRLEKGGMTETSNDEPN